VGFARWRSDVASGGNRYDDELAAALRATEIDLREHAVTGPWPVPDRSHQLRFAATLEAERAWLVNNIVGSAAPDTIERAADAGQRITLLMHYFPADDDTLSMADRRRLAASEARTVAAAHTVVVTSDWAAAEVSSRYGRTDAVVAEPGVERVALAAGSTADGRPPTLLWLGRLSHSKDPLTFIDALARLRDLDWSARLVGPDTVDIALSKAVRRRIDQAGLRGRVQMPGALEGQALESVWAEADLLVHTSRAETYGMVVSEALAHGIPSIVTSGTGALLAQASGASFPPGDAQTLANELRRWLIDVRIRRRWRERAVGAREALPTWTGTGQIVAEALRRD